MNDEILKFRDKKVIMFLENRAIDGQLDYDSFPAEEYKYFSRLSKLAYFDRQKGLETEAFKQKWKRLKKEYIFDREERDERLKHAAMIQKRLLKIPQLSLNLNLAREPLEALNISLKLIELLTEEPGLSDRIKENIGI